LDFTSMNVSDLAPVLTLDRIHFSRHGRPILSDISWQILPGQIAAVLGPNGCGKSTLLRLASGYLWPHSGAVRVLGRMLGDVPLAPLRARIGIVEATTMFPFDEDMTTREVVLTGYFSSLTMGFNRVRRAQSARAVDLLAQVGLAGREGQHFASMSTGERLRCLLARALVRKPELLLLDEPTAGLDLPGREAILATLVRLHRNGGGGGGATPAIVVVTHHLEEMLPGTTNVLLLSGAGRVVARGTPRQVLTNGHLSTAFKVPIHVVRRHGRFLAHVNPAAWEEML
jgi:iron complex transport system ATP-binding protein